jgi:hypothetical protein
MKTKDKDLIQRNIPVLVMLLTLGTGLYGYADVAPGYHSDQVTNAIQDETRAQAGPAAEMEIEYGISDTAGGYLVPGIEVRAARFNGNHDDFSRSYDSYRKSIKPIAADLYKYGLFVVLAVFVIVWLAVVANKWQRPAHISARHRGTDQLHLAYLIQKRRAERSIPDIREKGRTL